MQTEQKDNLIKILKVSLFLFIVIGSCIGLIRQCNLKDVHSLGSAEIYNCKGGGGRTTGFWIEFTIEIDGKSYKGASLITSSDINIPMVRKYFMGKTFPAVYYPSNPSNSNILILPSDFEKYNYIFPDSLNWVKRLIEENRN